MRPLPGDACHKGYRSVVIQDITIKTENTEFKLERYYSPSEGKTYEAPLPDHIRGEFGPSLKSWVLFWYFHSRIPENRIHKMLSGIGISISSGEISNIIVKNNDTFCKEAKDITEAGIKSSSYQRIDDTGARIGGTNQHFTVLCNDYFSAFFTNPKKNRLTAIGILSQKEELSFLINPYVISFLKKKLKAEVLSSLKSLFKTGEMTKEEFTKELDLAIPGLKERHRTMIEEAAAIAAYQEDHDSPAIERLVCDDAKQFYYIPSSRPLLDT